MSFLVDNLDKVKSRQSNALNTSPYAQEFTAHEIKLFEISLASCSIDDLSLVKLKTDKELTFSNHELAMLLHTKPNVISMEIEKTSARIMHKTIHLRKVLDDDSIEFEIINIIPYAKYKNGQLSINLNYRVLSYLLEIKDSFTEFNLRHLLAMSSSYSIKLYKLLYQYKNIKNRIFVINDLKIQFGIIDKYTNYFDFKKNIINPSVLQINNFTDLQVSYREIKLGRKVYKLKFLFEVKNNQTLKNPYQDEAIDITNDTIISRLTNELEMELSSQTKDLISKYQKEKGVEYVDASISYAKINAKTNFDKYLADTLTKGWAEVEIKKQIIRKNQVFEKVAANKQVNLKKEQDKEQDKLNKSIIQDKWNNLDDEEKVNYFDYANSILIKYTYKLINFSQAKQYLPLCIYAVSNQTSYDRLLELYVEQVLKVSLNINKQV